MRADCLSVQQFVISITGSRPRAFSGGARPVPPDTESEKQKLFSSDTEVKLKIFSNYCLDVGRMDADNRICTAYG